MLAPLALAQALPNADAYQRACLDGLQRAIGFEAAFFALPGELPTTIQIDAAALGAAFEARVYDAEVAPIREAALAQGGVAVDTCVLGEQRVRACRYYREHAAPIGGRHSLIGCLALRGQPIGSLMLGRTGARFREQDLALLRDALPALSLGRASYGLRASDPPLPGAVLSVMQHAALACTGRVERERVRLEAGQLIVRDTGDARELIAREGAHEMVWTRVDRREPRRSAWFYVELFQLALARARFRRRALFIGAGGGAAIRQFRHVDAALRIDVIELEPQVLRLADRWFGLGAMAGVATGVGDGVRAIAEAAPSTWDVLVIDAYGAALELPESFAAPSFWADAARAIASGGAVAINVIGTLEPNGVAARVAARMRELFRDVRVVPVLDDGDTLDPHALRNAVVLGTRR
jgi:hypothetical protein